MTPDQAVSVREFLERLMDERDRRYEERNQANKDAVRAALTAAEKATDKTEKALMEYKASSNEWRATLNDIVGRMLSRAEYDRDRRWIVGTGVTILIFLVGAVITFLTGR